MEARVVLAPDFFATFFLAAFFFATLRGTAFRPAVFFLAGERFAAGDFRATFFLRVAMGILSSWFVG